MGEPLKVIIVEDEALLAYEVEALIQDAGHSVVGWAATSEDAKQLVQEKEADLVLLDLHLADGLTGWDVANHIREQGEGAAAIVFMTANAAKIAPDCAGALGVIAKPYSTRGLHSALEFLHETLKSPPASCGCPACLRLAGETGEGSVETPG